ncbi:MAG: universal stress protein, partial [Phycisphaerales bacterium]|nr:universal stress protein [Phycisphaerales bacterium]
PDDFLARVARTCRRPILAMAGNGDPIRRVLVAYDGSQAAADALRSFAVLHAFAPDLVRVVSIGEDGLETEARIAEARSYLDSHGYANEGRSIEGNPSEAILEEAESFKADLIVMGAVGRSGIAKFLVGDTASTLLANSPVSLFIRY